MQLDEASALVTGGAGGFGEATSISGGEYFPVLYVRNKPFDGGSQ